MSISRFDWAKASIHARYRELARFEVRWRTPLVFRVCTRPPSKLPFLDEMVPFPEHVVQADGTIRTAGERQGYIWLRLTGGSGDSPQEIPVLEGKPRSPFELQISLTPEQLGVEGTVFVGSKAWQGVDPDRPIVVLPAQVGPPDLDQLSLLLVGGQSGRAVTASAAIQVADEVIRSFRYDLLALHDVMDVTDAASPSGRRLVRIAEEVLKALVFDGAGRPSVATAASALRDALQAWHAEDSGADRPKLYVIGNSHIDLTWLWTAAETRHKMHRTTATALRYQEMYPNYHFLQSQSWLYNTLAEDDPELSARVDQQVAAGKWDFAGGAFVEPDCNLSSGESLVRQLLLGQHDWRRRYGSYSRVMWLPDTFGYASCLPQLIRKAGMSYFVTQKLTWSENNVFPHGHFEWEGLDGTRVRCIFPQAYWVRFTAQQIAQYHGRYPSKALDDAMLFPYGRGAGGGGPHPEDLEMIDRLGAYPCMPEVVTGTVEAALDTLAARVDGKDSPIPVWRGELYLEFHRGTLTTHVSIKRRNRRGEEQLRALELFTTLAALAGHETETTVVRQRLEDVWRLLLFNQFHDILPGTSIREAIPEIHQRYDQMERLLDDLRTDMGCIPVRPSAYPDGRAEVADATFLTVSGVLARGGEQALRVFNANRVGSWVGLTADRAFGVRSDHETVESRPVIFAGAVVHRLWLRVDPLHALPVVLFSVVDASMQTSADVGHGVARKTASLEIADGSLALGSFTIRWNQRGCLTSLYDSVRDREWLGSSGLRLAMYDDRPTAWEAWEVDAQAISFELDDLALVEATQTAHDQLRMVWETALGSIIEMNMAAGPTADTLLFDLRVDWRERRRWLRLLADLQLRAGFATAETQFGYLERPAHANTSWEQAKFEFAAHRWIDVSEANGGMSLVNDGMYGHSFEGSQVGLSLVRSPAHPHPRAPHPPYTFPGEEEHFTDQGLQHFRWMLVAHDGSWRDGDTLAMADALNGAPVFVEMTGDLMPDMRIPEGVGLEALKIAEDGDGFVMRIVDQIGARRTAQITLPDRITSVEPVDLLEDPFEGSPAWSFEADAHTLRVTLGPFELVTFRLRVDG